MRNGFLLSLESMSYYPKTSRNPLKTTRSNQKPVESHVFWRDHSHLNHPGLRRFSLSQSWLAEITVGYTRVSSSRSSAQTSICGAAFFRTLSSQVGSLASSRNGMCHPLFFLCSYFSSCYHKMSSRWKHPTVGLPRATPGGNQGPACPRHGGERPRQQPRGQRLLRVEWRSSARQLASLQLGVDKSGGIRGARTSDCSQEVLLKQDSSATCSIQVEKPCRWICCRGPVFLNTVICVCSSCLSPLISGTFNCLNSPWREYGAPELPFEYLCLMGYNWSWPLINVCLCFHELWQICIKSVLTQICIFLKF